MTYLCTTYGIHLPASVRRVGLACPSIGKMLGHTQAATTQRYAHLADDPLRKAVDTVGARYLASMSGNKSSNNVVRIHNR